MASVRVSMLFGGVFLPFSDEIIRNFITLTHYSHDMHVLNLSSLFVKESPHIFGMAAYGSLN